MYEHLTCKNGPGSIWSPDLKKIVIESHSMLANDLFSKNHYHLYLKYAYAKAVVTKDNSISFWADLYDKMQIKRIGYSKRDEFDRLIASFGEHGFLREFSIPIDENLGILDGSHRLATSCAYNIEPFVEVYKNCSHQYDRIWFESVGFLESELEKIDSIESHFLSNLNQFVNLSIAVIWGCAFNFWEEIFSILKEKNPVSAHWINFDTVNSAKDFIIESYLDDGMEMNRLIAKSTKLTDMSTLVGIVILNNYTDTELREVKLKIRNVISPKMENYFFDSIIHIVDSKKTSNSLIRKYTRFKTVN